MTSKEAVVFVDNQVAYEVFELLEGLDDNVDLFWVLASRNSGLYVSFRFC